MQHVCVNFEGNSFAVPKKAATGNADFFRIPRRVFCLSFEFLQKKFIRGISKFFLPLKFWGYDQRLGNILIVP